MAAPVSLFERLLTGTSEDLATLFARLPPITDVDADRRRERIAQRLGLNVRQLVCGVGFNARAGKLPAIRERLGFTSYDALVSERNYLFISDVYHDLSVDNVLDIYSQLGADAESTDAAADLILSRLAHIESQIEATINPVMLGGYKLEIRAIYDHGLASSALVDARLRPEYEALRGITDEVVHMARNGAVPPLTLLARPGVSPEEKRRLLFHDLVTRTDVEARLAVPDLSARERRVLGEALGAKA